MSNPNSLTLEEVLGNIVAKVLGERAEQQENLETAIEEVGKENEGEIEVMVEEGEARTFYFDKGAEVFQKHLAKKGFVEERGFKQFVSPFKEEIERRGWEKVSQHRELGVRALVKEFYSNLGERKNLTCYVRGRRIPFGERAISQLLELRPVGECTEYDQL